MDKGTKIISGCWATLAVASMVGAFFSPLAVKIIGIAFGVMNLFVIASMVIENIKAKKDGTL